ncbi:MAG: pirin family protein [Armatimonadetes bacterium]|nr:pirin family protein [Armatimonadota bacterium]
MRPVEGIYPGPEVHWVGDGFRVAGYFSAIPDAMKRLDPFLMLDYAPAYDFPPTTQPRGVGVHPHRGFETVTIAFQGSVAHHDSTGASGVIGPGDVQWMTAGAGILHKEYHDPQWARQGGPFQMAQLWVNLPRAHKDEAPHYQAITADRIAQVALPGDAGLVRLIAGEFQGERGPANTYSPLSLLEIRLNANGQVELPFPPTWNVGLLLMGGEVTINGTDPAKLHDFVVFENRGERITVAATREAHLLVLAGEPIGEPVVPYGPFVMNTVEEIQEALDDYQAGKFGQLAD